MSSTNKIRKSPDTNSNDSNNDNKKLKLDNNSTATGSTTIDKLIIKSPIGPLLITANDKELQCIKLYNFDKKINETILNEQIKSTSSSLESNTILKQFNQELDQYFKGTLKEFKSPINISLGTEFQQKVWNHLISNVTYGITSSYKQVAMSMGLGSKFSRGIASACRLNKFLLIVPCHRIISSQGTVIGYNGKEGIDKQFILSNIEKASMSSSSK